MPVAYAIGAAGVPVVVKAEDGHVVRLEECTLGGVDGVGRESGGGVLVIVESGLVGDDEVAARLSQPAAERRRWPSWWWQCLARAYRGRPL